MNNRPESRLKAGDTAKTLQHDENDKRQSFISRNSDTSVGENAAKFLVCMEPPAIFSMSGHILQNLRIH